MSLVPQYKYYWNEKTLLRHKQHWTKSRILPFEYSADTLLKTSLRHKQHSSKSRILPFKYFANNLLSIATAILQRLIKSSWIQSFKQFNKYSMVILQRRIYSMTALKSFCFEFVLNSVSECIRLCGLPVIVRVLE